MKLSEIDISYDMNIKFLSYNVTIHHANLYKKKTCNKDEMNYHLILDPLVINFYSKKSSVKMAELYQRRFTLK